MEMVLIGLVILAAMAVAAYLNRDKLRAILDRKDEAMLDAPDVRPSQPMPRLAGTPVKAAEDMTREEWEAYRNTFVASTRGFIPTWEQKLARDKAIRDAAVAGAGPDRDGFDMNQANGFLAHPPTLSGESYLFTYGSKPGWAIRVMPYAGSQILKVNGQAISGTYAIIENPPVLGGIILEVEFVGERYTVQYAPR